MPGPPPKRTEQRRRVNKPDIPVTQAPSRPTGAPELHGEHTDTAVRFWESLGKSGQSQWYEPSDWVAAELIVRAIDAFVHRPSAIMLSTIQSGMTVLLVTEGDRRRLRVELEPAGDPGSEADAAISDLAQYRDSASA